MKYLKLFESVNIEEHINELEEKTQIKIIKNEIDELFLDLSDDIPYIIFGDNIKIKLIYQRKNTRSCDLSYTYFTDALKSNHKVYASEINYLKDFLNKFEIAKKISMEYWRNISTDIYSIQDLQKLKQNIEDIKDRSKLMGYNFWIYHDWKTEHNQRPYYQDTEISSEESIDILFNLDSFRNHFEDNSNFKLRNEEKNIE
jgi:hypothetical protein